MKNFTIERISLFLSAFFLIAAFVVEGITLASALK